MGKTTRFLTSIDIQDAAGNSIGKSMATDPRDPRLVLRALSKWQVTPELGSAIPARYEVKYQEGGKALVHVAPWPVADKHYLVQLSQFSGEVDDLFRLLREHRYSLPVRQLVTGESTLVLASLQPGSGTVEPGWSGNQFVFRFPKVQYPGSTADASRKMYVLFPLTKAQAEETAKNLNAKKAEDVIPDILREKPSPIDDDKAVLAPGGPARWYEVGIGEGLHRFERKVTVESAGQPAADGKEIPNYRVAVYQLQPGYKAGAEPGPQGNNANPLPFQVKHPDTNSAVWAINQLEPAWIPGMERLRAAAKSPANSPAAQNNPAKIGD